MKQGGSGGRVLIVAAGPNEERQLVSFARDAGFRVVGTTQDGDEGVRLALHHQPDLVITNVNLSVSNGLTLTEQLWARAPGIGCVVVADEGSWGAHRRAMQAGALDFLLPPLSEDATDALRSAHGQAQRRRSLVGRGRSTAPDRDPATLGAVVSVISAKGGLGRSTVAASLSAALAMDERTILCDMDFQFGDVSTWGAKAGPERTIAQLSAVLRAGELTQQDVAMIALERFGGVALLPAPRSPLDASDWSVCYSQLCPLSTTFEASKASMFPAAELVEYVRAWYQWVVVDHMAGLFDPVVATLRASTQAVVVTTCEVGALRATRTYLDILDKIVSVPRIVIANRPRRSDARGLVEQALGGRERVVFVPDDAEYTRRLMLDAAAPAQLKDRKPTKVFAQVAQSLREARVPVSA